MADTEHMTNGNSATLLVNGDDGQDQFEVNHNRAKLYLSGGNGDDIFVINTFLVLKENPNDPNDITNLAALFGGAGANRYQYLQNGPVYIDGGAGNDTIVINGTAIGDTFVVTKNFVAGAGRIVYFTGIEKLELRGAGGNDQFYVLSSDANLEITIRGGSGDDVINLGGKAPVMLFRSAAIHLPAAVVPGPGSAYHGLSHGGRLCVHRGIYEIGLVVHRDAEHRNSQRYPGLLPPARRAPLESERAPNQD